MTPRGAAYETLFLCEKDGLYSNIAVDNTIKKTINSILEEIKKNNRSINEKLEVVKLTDDDDSNITFSIGKKFILFEILKK